LNTVKKILISLVFIISATTASAQDSKIAIADLTWTGATAIGHIIQAIITGPMGGEAEIIKGASDGSIIFASMDKGDGSIDVHPDIWMPVQSNNWEKYIEENNTVAINKPYNGTQGMFIPYYLKDKITSFSDLANPAIASMFDKDGNGKGEYWAGDTSWTSTKIWQVKFKSYGLDNYGNQKLFLMKLSKTNSRLLMTIKNQSYFIIGRQNGYLRLMNYRKLKNHLYLKVVKF